VPAERAVDSLRWEDAMRIAKAAAVVVLGVLWFVALSVAEGYRIGIVRVEDEATVLVGIAIAAVASLIGFVVALRASRLLVAILAISMALCGGGGLLSYSLPIAVVAPPEVLDLSTLFARGGSSLAVWATVCGLVAIAIRGLAESSSERTRSAARAVPHVSSR
jgi:hypothetical protein